MRTGLGVPGVVGVPGIVGVPDINEAFIASYLKQQMNKYVEDMEKKKEIEDKWDKAILGGGLSILTAKMPGPADAEKPESPSSSPTEPTGNSKNPVFDPRDQSP